MEIVRLVDSEINNHWEMIRHRDIMRMSFFKFYIVLMTGMGSYLFTIFKIQTTKISILNFLKANNEIIGYSVLFPIIIGIILHGFLVTTRKRNIESLKKIDSMRNRLLIETEYKDISETLRINPKSISYWGTDAMLNYVISLFTSSLLFSSLILLQSRFWISVLVPIIFFALMNIHYFSNFKE